MVHCASSSWPSCVAAAAVALLALVCALLRGTRTLPTKQLLPATAVCGAAVGECAALVGFAQALLLRSWRASDGWLDPRTPHCAWLGVACDARGRVTRLEQDWNVLFGTLPASTGDDLVHLQALLLRHNEMLRGPLPASLGRLRELEHLSVSGSGVSGDLGQLVNRSDWRRLRVLGMSGTQVGGALPARLPQLLPRLRRLHLRRTHVSFQDENAPGLCAWLAALEACTLEGSPGASACGGVCDRPPPPPRAAFVARHALVDAATGDTLLALDERGGHMPRGGVAFSCDAADVLLPYELSHVRLLARLARRVAASGTAFVLAPQGERAVEVLDNKTAFAAFMAAHAATFGAAAPRLLARPTPDAAAAVFPAVLKPAFGAGGEGVSLVRSLAEYEAALLHLPGGAAAPHLLQAYAPGQRFGTAHLALLRGRLLGGVYYTSWRPRLGLTPSIHAGPIARFRAAADSPHAPLFEALLGALNYTGLASVNYVVRCGCAALWRRCNATGAVAVLEVNPRAGLSLHTRPADLRRLVLLALAAAELEAAAGGVRTGETEHLLHGL